MPVLREAVVAAAGAGDQTVYRTRGRAGSAHRVGRHCEREYHGNDHAGTNRDEDGGGEEEAPCVYENADTALGKTRRVWSSRAL